jgi:hypothetical protein
MKQKTLPILILGILFSCSTSIDNNKSETKLPDSAVLPSNFYKKLKGKIGDDIYITMDLIKRRDSVNKDNSITGHYYYDKVGEPLELYGTIADSGSFEFLESNAKGESTGTFKGKFISQNEARGTFTNTRTQKEYAFELKADEHESMFCFNEYYNENCKAREINMKSNQKDTLNWLDTMCSSVHINLVTLSGNDKVSKKINDMLLSCILGVTGGEKPQGSIMQLLHSIDNYGIGDILDAEYSTGIVSNEENYLSMSVAEWENSGGAHPNGASYFLNFNKQTGDTISLLDIVKPETIDELVYRGKQQFIKENGPLGKDSDWFFGGEFALPASFSIGKGGLLFQYNSYEAGPYAAGAPQFFLSWKQIKDIVRAEYLK